jgi:hypothetical protein
MVHYLWVLVHFGKAVIVLKWVPRLLGFFYNSSDNIFLENIHKRSEEEEKNLSNHGDQ